MNSEDLDEMPHVYGKIRILSILFYLEKLHHLKLCDNYIMRLVYLNILVKYGRSRFIHITSPCMANLEKILQVVNHVRIGCP